MKQERYGTWIYKKMTENSEVKLPPVNPILEGKGWDNHEDSFEETLRRECYNTRDYTFYYKKTINN